MGKLQPQNLVTWEEEPLPELSFSSLTQYTGAGPFQAHFGLALK